MEERAEDEQRSKKLQAGREKLAHFRQRKTKGESSKAQKKTPKRKNKAAHTNDVSKEEDDTLVKVEYEKTDPVLETKDITSDGITSLLDVPDWQEKMTDFEAKLGLNPDAIGCAEGLSDLQTPLKDNLSTDLHKTKQTTVSDFDDGITEVSSNLQKALGGEEVEDEALSLSSRIQAIQSQLQNASKVLKSKSPGKTELYEAELELSLLQSSFMNQAERMSQLDRRAQELERELEASRKKTRANDNQVEKLEHLMQEQQSRLEFLQEKLEKSENSVSLLQQELFSRNQEIMQPKHEISIQTELLLTSIGSDLEGGGDSTHKANEMDTATLATLVVELKERLADSETLRESLCTKIKEQMLTFEMERSSWEQKHSDMVADLTLKLQEAEEIVDQEKYEKDRLNQELRDLKNNLRLEAEDSEAIKLQHERGLQMYELKLQSLEEDNTNLDQQSSNTWKLQDSEDYSQDMSDLKITDKDTRVDHFRHELEDLKKNLSRVKARKELENSKAVELDKAEDEVAPALTSLDKYLIPNQMFDLNNSQEDLSGHSKFELDSDFILEQSLNSTMGGNINLLSSPMPITGVLAGGATLGTLLDPESFAVYLSSNTKPSENAEHSPVLIEDLSQKCSALMESLQDKEEQLQKSSEALTEALQNWRDVTAELAATKLEMEKVIKKEFSEEQLRMVEEIKSERDDLRKRINDQEQLLREVQEQKSLKEEFLSLLIEEKTTLENRLSVVEKELENTVELCKNLEVGNQNLDQNLHNLEMARESERQEFDNKLNSKGVEQQLLEDAIRAKETEFYQREENLREEVSVLRQEKEQLESKLQEEVNHLNAEFEKRMDVSGESWKEQIASLNQAHESQITLLQSGHEGDLQKVCSDLKAEKQKLEEHVQQLEKAHSTEMEQTQSAHNIEMEAMRLSLNNLHTTHLELSQSNLLKEKENALVQLRDQLNNKWAQDLAILQSKNQFEVEHLREEHRRALESLREQLSKEISQQQQEHLKEIELLKENHATKSLDLEGRYKKELESVQKICQEQKLEFERKSEELRLMEEESLVKLSNLQELHILEREEMQNLHLEERKQWEINHDGLAQQLKVSLEANDLCRKEMLNLEEQNNKERTELIETNSKHLEKIEQLQKELLQQNEELSRQIESLSEGHAMEESKLRDHKDLEILDHDRCIEKQEWESQENKPFQELEQLKKELSQVTELHSHQTAQLQQKHSDEILHLQDGQSKEIKGLQDLLALEKQEWGRQQEENAKKMLQLQMQCENLENTYLQEKNEWEMQTEQQSEILKRLNKETVQLQDEHSKAIKQLQEKLDKEIEEIQERHIMEKEELEKQRDQHSQELDLLVNQHSQELKRIGEKLLQNSLQKQEEHSKQLEQIQEECAKQLLELQQQHLIEIQKMNDLYMQENPDWKEQANQYFQQMQSNQPLPQTAPQESCTHQELLKNGICLIEEIHAKENIVLEQCQQHSKQLHHARNMNPEEDLSELIEEHNVQELQDQQVKQMEASQELHEQLSESSHQQHKAFVPEADNEQVYQQQENEILDDYVHYPTNTLQINYSEVKINSSEEIQLLWSQVNRSRASRQELNELKQQLIARSTQLEEIERMRKNFEQERLSLKAEHEKEMEELRIYFEQKSSSAEETYREELEILHQRLREMNDDEKVEMTPLNCSTLTLEESFESEKLEFLQHLTDQLEEHKEELAYSRLHVEEKHRQELENLRAALSLQYKEDVFSLKMDLSEKYTSEIEALKKKHSLDLEKLRARLSEEHIREITRVQLQNTHEAMKHGENIKKAQVPGHNDQTLGAEWPSDGGGKNSESSSSDHALSKPLEKSIMCQMDLESGSKSDDEKQAQDDGEVKKSQLEVFQAQHAKELVYVREKMANDLEEITKRLKEEKERALKEAEERLAQVHMENAKLQKALLRETLIKSASVEYQEVGNDDPNLQSESLISGVPEEKRDLESGDKDLTLKAPDVENTAVLSELGSIDDLNAGLPELQSHKEPYIQLAELLEKHQEELHARVLDHEAHIQSLEASHLVKLDSLESSYLSEIQKIRDEHALAVEELEQCLLNRLQEKEKEAQDQLEKSRVQWLQQQELELERLRQEMASIQLAKFQEMSKELQVAHKEDLKQELDQQLFQIEVEKKQALNVLQEEVLRMESQNQLALQELRDLHKVEVEHQTIKLQEELKKATEELQKQELVIAELTSERQALSTNLQGQSDQQLRYQEEIELLKCQSEMLLEQQICLLKDEFCTEKRSALQELEEQFNRDLEKVRAEHRMEKDDFMKQLEDKKTDVLQLQDKVSSLTKDMDASQSQMDVLVQRRERENQEGEHLVAMLQSDVHAAQQERRKLQDSCQRLLKIFADVLKSTLVTEDLISKKIGLCLDNSLSQTDDERTMDSLAKSLDKNRLSPDCETMTEHSLMSSDEGYELSEYLCDSVLGSLEVGLENEEKIVRMGHRLRSAVERLLDMVTDSALQLEQTREMQKCFEDEFKSRNQDMAQVVIQNQDLLKELAKETEEKNQLQLELHKSQGLIDGFALEKASLEEALVSKESSEHRLVVELEKSREQVKILTQEPCVSGKEKEVLQRLQEVLSGSDIDAELLKETERLLKEELELHCQAKQDRSNLISQMKMLEMELEEQMSRSQELMRKTNAMTDLQQQIQSLEKQLKSQRQFMDEQAMEREHERDEFQQEIQKLEEQLKQALKSHGDCKAHGLHDWGAQIETLEARVKEKADNCKLLLQGREHLEEQITERNEEIDKMMVRIQELEQAVLSNADAAKKVSQLEAELQKMQKIEKEVMQDKEALQQQQFSNVLQISALQTKLDEARHRVPVEGEPNLFLKQELQAEREALQRKEKEAESLVEQLEQFREELMNKTEEVFQLNMQLDVQRKQYERAVQQAQEEYLRLKDEVSSMRSRKCEDGASSTLQLPQALLQEKNQEIDHLNEQILRLQQEATCSQSAEMEELRSLIELLRSDLDRLRKDKEEEIEQLHEVIEKLQKELEQLGPNRHEISDSQESLDQLGFGEVENLQLELRKGAKKLQGEGNPTQVGGEDCEHTHRTALEALQQELEEKNALHITEIEVLERNLHNVQQSCRQLETLQVQHGNLQEESELLWSRFSEREEQIASLSSQLQELQDRLREKDGFLMDKELIVQTMQEQNEGDRTEYENQLAHSALSLEATKMDLQKLQEESISLKNILSKCSDEQREREEEYRREIQYLKQLHSDWEEKARILTEEVQTQTEDEFMELKAVPELVSLKKQLQMAENLASLREADLHGAQTQLANMKQELEELHAECERREAKAQDVLQQLQKREICVAELQTHSQKLGTQVKKLQDALVSQEAMLVLMSEALPEKNFDDVKHKPDLSRPGKATSFSESLTDLSTWDSPEMVRKQDEAVHSLGAFTPFSELSIAPSADLVRSKSTCIKRSSEHHDLLGSSTPSLSESNFSAQGASPLRGEGHTDYGSCDDLRSSRDDQMDSEKSDEPDYRSELGTKSKLNCMENLIDLKQKMDSLGTTGLSPQLQRMLDMVHEESCKILELSERPVVKSTPSDSAVLAIKIDTWQKEKQSLQETIQSLSSALAQAADKGEKESTTLDWRRDLLQSVQALLESERAYLRLELQSDIRHGSGDKNLLSEKMEHLIKEQEEQKRLVLEHVLAVDRSSLLSEIQDLRSQLRMAHLQNQEKLQKLQDTLTSTEEKGHSREHQLRRQVELLEYKLQQEASIAEDVKGSLVREKERATEQYKLLLQEQASVSHLHSELEEKALEMESLRKSHKELQKGLHMETSKLREELENKEKTMSAYIKTIQTESQAERLRSGEERSHIQRALEINEKSLQEVSQSLEEHKMLNAKMSAALSQEQTLCSNLKKELDIEQSRCKALLAQERGKLSETVKELGKEKQHSLSLVNTLTLERGVLEQVRQQHAQELTKMEEERQQGHKLVLASQSELKDERKRARDLAAMIEKTQQQAVHAKRQLESELQVFREEMQKEREAGVKLRALLESLQSQKQQLDSVLDQQRERELRLQKERDQYQAQVLSLQEKERTWVKELEQESKGIKHAEASKARVEEQERRIMDLQLQHERDRRRIQELQQMLADLEEQERALASRKSRLWNDSRTPTKNDACLIANMQRVWQQLFHIVLQVKKWVQSQSIRTNESFPSEAEVTQLLESLSELKSEMQKGYVQPAQSSSGVIDVLKRENEELADSVSQLAKEKLELKSQLAKSHQESLQKNKDQVHADVVDSVLEAERAVWLREKRLLQVALKHAESELGKATLENRPMQDVPNSKMQRLYRKYLRAESFRKALVYQKKYLLLLLGGFQACEKATLSLIARMGVYPSPADLQIHSKCKTGLGKFRSTVRAVIAISRLKFLVRKWHKVNRKSGGDDSGTRQVPVNRMEVLQQLGGTTLNSPPTRDLPFTLYHSPNTNVGTASMKPSQWTPKWTSQSPSLTHERSRHSSQDPGHSITEYIQHLEMVQRRLGGVQNVGGVNPGALALKLQSRRGGEKHSVRSLEPRLEAVFPDKLLHIH
ncbi:pericentrin isoform X2 [Phyllobates terribilis]|uniref:pericentrin isoform X2 n=1 Tax=Phyllobates terribilis TaxID=111132 RepID=UPI003CCA9E8F